MSRLGMLRIVVFLLTTPRPRAKPDADFDSDRIPDAGDNSPLQAKPEQADVDGDGSGDGCDRCPGFDEPYKRLPARTLHRIRSRTGREVR